MFRLRQCANSIKVTVIIDFFLSILILGTIFIKTKKDTCFLHLFCFYGFYVAGIIFFGSNGLSAGQVRQDNLVCHGLLL